MSEGPVTVGHVVGVVTVPVMAQPVEIHVSLFEQVWLFGISGDDWSRLVAMAVGIGIVGDLVRRNWRK